MFRFPALFSMPPVCRVWRFLSLLVAWLLCVGVLQAQTVYGDYKVLGTGADAGVSFEFLASVPPLTPGLSTTFDLIACTVPSGEDCGTGVGQVGYSAGGGVIRLTTAGMNGKTRTWNFLPSCTAAFISRWPAQARNPGTSLCLVQTLQPASHRATPPVPRFSFRSR